MKIVIPMAGWGTRMRPHTWSKPKQLVAVAGKTYRLLYKDTLADPVWQALPGDEYVPHPQSTLDLAITVRAPAAPDVAAFVVSGEESSQFASSLLLGASRVAVPVEPAAALAFALWRRTARSRE